MILKYETDKGWSWFGDAESVTYLGQVDDDEIDRLAKSADVVSEQYSSEEPHVFQVTKVGGQVCLLCIDVIQAFLVTESGKTIDILVRGGRPFAR